PLKKDVGTIAVIGPNSDEWLMLLGNYNGVPSDPITPLRGIREKVAGKSKVLYAQGSELVEGMPTFRVIPSEVLSHGADQKGLHVDYYTDREFKSPILYSSVDPVLDANWSDKAPRQDMDDDDFGVKWTGDITPTQSGMYQLGIITTCKVNLYLDGKVIADTSYHFHDEFGDPRLRKSDPIRLEAGKKYKLLVEAGELYGDAQVQLVWATPRKDPKVELEQQALDVAKQADVVIMCLGLTARLEGEQMDVDLEGFRGGDRTRIDLPDVQEQLIRTAIADVLFGDYNPGGRLPVTFYKSVKDLPPFEDYDMAGHTYRYFKGQPLYPFGYGLSYTTFQYGNLKLADSQNAGDPVKVSVEVKNTGQMAGDEVVQVYVSDLNAPVPVPIRSLTGFKRIHLNPGESRTVSFEIAPEGFSIINAQDQREVLPGEFEVSVGGSQPDVSGANVLKAKIKLM
ncbi:MAG: glycoside hydrolase family 3 C-terminal domain-containing protein, partial [Acidobacteriota bacterium]